MRTRQRVSDQMDILTTIPDPQRQQGPLFVLTFAFRTSVSPPNPSFLLLISLFGLRVLDDRASKRADNTRPLPHLISILTNSRAPLASDSTTLARKFVMERCWDAWSLRHQLKGGRRRRSISPLLVKRCAR